ncbi:hypothetical protein ES703_106499 [subsurface metagenome]
MVEQKKMSKAKVLKDVRYKEQKKTDVDEKDNPEKEIEKLCEKNKISIDLTGYNKIKGAGKLNLLHDGLLKFIKTQKAEDILLIGEINVKVKISDREFDVERESIIDLLNQEELISQYLDLGEVDGMWYFGFKLGNQEAIMMDSAEIYRNTEQLLYRDVCR